MFQGVFKLFLFFILTFFSTGYGCEFEEPEEGKVILVTIPKAGTHLLKKAVEKITKEQIVWLHPDSLSNPTRRPKFISSNKKVYLLHAFKDMDDIRMLNPEKYPKILMIRDPRDVLVSFYHHILDRKPWMYTNTFKKMNFWNLSPEDQVEAIVNTPQAGPLQTFSPAFKWMSDPTILVVRFEDLIGEKGGGSYYRQLATLERIANHIGYPLSQDQLIRIADDLFGGTWTFRKGQIGEWKTFFTESQKAKLKEIMGKDTINLGYGNDW